MIENNVEFSNIDLRYQSLRLPHAKREKDLLASISERGIEEPLQVAKSESETFVVLLDGFKRLRAGRKLGYNIFPIEILATTEIEAILKLLKISNAKSLHILEQVRLVNELHNNLGIKVRDIAFRLERSTGWVCSRLGILKEFGPKSWNAIFKDQLPPSVLLYTLRPFRHLNKENKSAIDEFVEVIAKKNLRQRDVEILAHAWFKGGPELKEQIKNGDLAWILEKAKELFSPNGDTNVEGLTEKEGFIVKDLVITQKYMGRIINTLPLLKEGSPQFKSRASMLAKGILNKQTRLCEVLDTLSGSL